TGSAVPRKGWCLPWRDCSRVNLQDTPLATPQEMRAYRVLQDAVSPGAGILVRLDKPFLLDYTRNPLYVMDVPCGSSPPPGLPCPGSVTDIERYLADRGVRALAFAYKADGVFPYAVYKDRLDLQRYPRTIAVQAKYTFLMDARFHQLIESRPRLY